MLYSHFAGKDAIAAAVALDGFAEFATTLRAAQAGAEQHAATCRAYLEFAEANPALYNAMFTLGTNLVFARDETPAPAAGGVRRVRHRTRAAGGRPGTGRSRMAAWTNSAISDPPASDVSSPTTRAPR